MLIVQSIFRSLDGEFNGFDNAGQVSIFVRLRGCNLRCAYCDTQYSQPFNTREGLGHMPIRDIFDSIVSLQSGLRSPPKVTITGGEPLLQGEVPKLINTLVQEGFDVTVETNGSMSLSEYDAFPRVFPDGFVTGRVRFVMDYKLPSSGMEDSMDPSNWMWLHAEDAMKFVIADHKDLDRALWVLDEETRMVCKLVFSPAIATQEDKSVDLTWASELATMVAHDDRIREHNVQFSLQLHKVLWPHAENER